MNGLFLDILRKKKIKMIYDFDDAIYLPKSSQKGNYEKTITMINSADHVIVSSPSLLAFCKDQGVISNVDLITTPVDTRIIKPPDKREEKDTRERDLLTIGWIGSPWTTKYLLDVSDVFRKLSKVINIRLLALGTHGDFEIKGVRLDKIQWSVENEIHYLREMDIGIMPLSKDKWAEAKGGYKLFLYMAAGLPVLASSVGFNNQIVQHGVNGYLCNKQQDWYDYLKKLHEDATLRLRMGMAGRSEAEKKFSYKINSQKLYSVIDQLIL
ncbi:MAG TPA: glycosyltransferase [Balneolales bacterium]|nr:glycosyltransferase [Balneolales bacterium]